MSTATLADTPHASDSSFSLLICRYIAWAIVATMFVFLLNVYLSFWRDWPGAEQALSDQSDLYSWLQLGFYGLALLLPALYVRSSTGRTLRADNDTLTAVAAYIARFAFWVVLLVGLVDAIISFMRVEELLAGVVGEEMERQLGRSQYRGPYVHLPLIGLALVLAAITRTLGFTWLALLVVIAELQIVITRFVFSYEQAFMGDLVRFWYAGLFLFSSAYTLVEEGHVRVDVLYHGFSPRTRGLINAIGSLLLGLPLCWIILVLGMGQSTSIITSPILALEITQAGFGMYIKYLMAGMLAIFATTMIVQFSAYFLDGIADYCGLPGKHEHDTEHDTLT